MAAQPKPLIQPNAQNQYEVTSEDLPLSCPMPQMYLWNSHPARVSADRGHRLGEVPLLQRRVHPETLTELGAGGSLRKAFPGPP